MTPIPGSPRSDLCVKAVRDDQAWVLVPKRLFIECFPDDFIHNYAHWYAIDGGYIEIRPLLSPWVSSEHHWRLRKVDWENSWRLENREHYLVGSRSRTANTLAGILNPLEKPPEIHGRLDKVKFTLYIDLPRLRLEFVVPERSTTVQCRQYPGMIIDAKQACNALAGDHVRVNVRCEAQWHAYSIDERLGRFVDNGSLQSKLFLAYLYAITSYFLPDPLTRRTGTEQALSILRSASVRSFDRLRPENVAILTRIATLTPQRRFYPDNEQVMQSVEWRHALSCLSQHPGFYEEVAAIRDQNLRVTFYYPGEEPAMPSLPGVNQHLLLRDKIRTSSFRVSQFGSEDHTGKHDRPYASRDAYRCSPNSTRAFTISKMLVARYPVREI
ncbi:hypothetical protein N7539_008492 [Penicillium diatomitis]|uniref:Uncharacterized protein n=1 Tax=Penicillium diatomitis TaxID=2819901 RepID=A0A9X0BLZ8_9EURO|nr:uncharacterized protein N7539_008492 [Penicillium diatomitis]KAJ5471923.1 hypothetical protein N7539_008492 [Penicillium diatomitis]